MRSCYGNKEINVEVDARPARVRSGASRRQTLQNPRGHSLVLSYVMLLKFNVLENEFGTLRELLIKFVCRTASSCGDTYPIVFIT